MFKVWLNSSAKSSAFPASKGPFAGSSFSENFLVSRKITRLVSERTKRSYAAIQEEVEKFVAKIRELRIVHDLPLSSIVNADQSGFQKQLTSGRTLAPRGVKTVEMMVRAVTSTSHSYTILPLFFANGTLSPKLFVTLGEPNGEFPQSFENSFTNLAVTYHTSHIMTKKNSRRSGSESVYSQTICLISYSCFSIRGLL